MYYHVAAGRAETPNQTSASCEAMACMGRPDELTPCPPRGVTILPLSRPSKAMDMSSQGRYCEPGPEEAPLCSCGHAQGVRPPDGVDEP